MSNIDKLYEKSTKLQGLLEYHLSEEIVEGQHIEKYKWVKAKDVTNEDIKSMDKQIILFKFFFLKKKGFFLNDEEIQFSNNKVMINNNSMTFKNFEDFLDENLKKIDNNKKNLRSKFLNLSSVPINDNTVRISDERLKSKKNARSQFVRNGTIRNDTITNIKQLIKEKVSTIDIGNKNFIFDFLQNLSSHKLSNFLKFLQMNSPDQVSQILEFLFKEEDLEKVEKILRFILKDEFHNSDLNELYITLIDVERQRRRNFVQDNEDNEGNKGQIYYSELIKRERLRILKQKINIVISPQIFKRTINTILNYLKSPRVSSLKSRQSLHSLTANHFNNSINDSKFSNLLSLLQFEEENAEKYKKLFKGGPGLVRTESNKQDTPLQRLNIFQIVTLVILFRNYLNHKKDQATLKNYLNSIKKGNNNSDKNIRLLYLVIINEFRQRFPINKMNTTKTYYRNQIREHYPINYLENIVHSGNKEVKDQVTMIGRALEGKTRLDKQLRTLTNKRRTIIGLNNNHNAIFRDGKKSSEKKPTKKTTGNKKTTDKKVKKIYKGPRGGKYYITKGRKVYI